jgi:hypothetical protein
VDLQAYSNNYTTGVGKSWRDLLNSANTTGEFLTGEGQALLSVGAGGLKAINSAVNDLLPGNKTALQQKIDTDPILNYTPSSAAGKGWRDLLGSLVAPVADAAGTIKSGIASVAGNTTANVIADVATLAGARVAGEGSLAQRAPVQSWRDALQTPVKPNPTASYIYDADKTVAPRAIDPYAGLNPERVKRLQEMERLTADQKQTFQDRAREISNLRNDYGNPRTLENNASGESSASVEAINRNRMEQAAGQTRYLVDPDGNMIQIKGVDSVDAIAPKGHIIIQKGVGADPYTILDRGGLPQAHAKGLLNRALSGINSTETQPTAAGRTSSVSGERILTLQDVKSYAKQNGMTSDQALHFLGMSGYRIQ